jgi:hypothetical protein
MVESGQAATLAEALDKSVGKLRRLENRKRLANATARYYEQTGAQITAEENALATDMMSAANSIDFDKEI